MRRRGVVRTALDDPLRLFLRGIEHTLRDRHVFERQVVLIGMQLFGPGAELLVVELTDDGLQAAARLFGFSQSSLVLGQGRLRLDQERLQTLVLFLENHQIHALNQAHERRQRHRRQRA